MTDDDALALCAYQEARGEPEDGIAAVARVILNRTALKYASDGTIPGTVFRHAQFSWTEFDMIAGRYGRVCWTPEQVDERASGLLDSAQRTIGTWTRVTGICEQVKGGTYPGGPQYQALGSTAVLYCNPTILPHLPPWAVADKQVARIGHQTFYRA